MPFFPRLGNDIGLALALEPESIELESHRYQDDRRDAITDNQRTFLAESTGCAFNASDQYIAGAFYIRFLLYQLPPCPNTIFEQAFGSGGAHVARDRLFPLMTLIMKSLRSDRQVSVDDLIQLATKADALHVGCATPGPEYQTARKLVIAAFGWTTMLYTTHLGPTPNPNELTLDTEPAKVFSVAHNLDGRAQRPLLEIINSLEGGFPVHAKGELACRPIRVPASTDLEEDALHVSCLNAAILCKLGSVEFCWVKCLGSHLDFDTAKRRLNVFCLPSFCQINSLTDTNLARALDEHYQDWNKPKGFTPEKFVQEVLLSYKLLFADDKRARKIWRQRERMKAKDAAGGECDPVLEKLCYPERPVNGRQTYNKASDFAIFGQRLQLIQDDIVRQRPNSLSALWQDTRDPLRRYTFFAVLAIGLVGLVLAMIQLVASVIETVYTVKAYDTPGPSSR